MSRPPPLEKHSSSSFQLEDDSANLKPGGGSISSDSNKRDPTTTKVNTSNIKSSFENYGEMSGSGHRKTCESEASSRRQMSQSLDDREEKTRLRVTLTVYSFVLIFTFIILFGEALLLEKDYLTSCPAAPDGNIQLIHYENPDYDQNPCRFVRLPRLAFLTIEECDLCRRMLLGVLLGGVIGFERRSADRPAGIRTMGLVSLGACFFTICSMLGFRSSTMGWDSSRVTAAIPSGVGFLGAGLIWKGSTGKGENEVHQVHGLTTAASLWLSAAVGVGCGGALYFETLYTVVLVVFVLRFGPKMYLQDEDEDEDDDEEDEEDEGDDGENVSRDNEARADHCEETNDKTSMDATPRMHEPRRAQDATSSISTKATDSCGMATDRQGTRESDIGEKEIHSGSHRHVVDSHSRDAGVRLKKPPSVKKDKRSYPTYGS